jgi:hypothetical protein
MPEASSPAPSTDIDQLPGDGDTLTVIEHWLISDVAGVKLQATVHADIADAYRRQGATVEGPFVAAEQLQGAVEALRWALGFIEYQGEPSPLDDPREGEADAESYRRALAIVGAVAR